LDLTCRLPLRSCCRSRTRGPISGARLCESQRPNVKTAWPIQKASSVAKPLRVADPRSASLLADTFGIIRVGERTLDRFPSRPLQLREQPAYAHPNQAHFFPDATGPPVRLLFVEWRGGEGRFR